MRRGIRSSTGSNPSRTLKAYLRRRISAPSPLCLLLRTARYSEVCQRLPLWNRFWIKVAMTTIAMVIATALMTGC